jgi:hypothetical protein
LKLHKPFLKTPWKPIWNGFVGHVKEFLESMVSYLDEFANIANSNQTILQLLTSPHNEPTFVNSKAKQCVSQHLNHFYHS